MTGRPCERYVVFTHYSEGATLTTSLSIRVPLAKVVSEYSSTISPGSVYAVFRWTEKESSRMPCVPRRINSSIACSVRSKS